MAVAVVESSVGVLFSLYVEVSSICAFVLVYCAEDVAVVDACVVECSVVWSATFGDMERLI